MTLNAMTFQGGPGQSSHKEIDVHSADLKAEKGSAPLGPFLRAIREANDESPNRIDENIAEISKGLRAFGHYLKNDLLIDFSPLIPIEVEGKQQLYFNSKALGRDLALFGIMLGGSLVSWFCSRQPVSGGNVPVPTPDSGNNNNSDCGAIITAMNGLATQIGAESFSVIGVDVTHIDSVEEITPDIRQACFIPGAANIEIAAQLDNFTIVSFIAPDGDQDGGLRPVIGVVDRGAAGADGVAPMMLVDATDSGLSVGRNSAGELTVGLDQACLDGNGVKGCSQAVMELVAQDDDLNAFAVNVLGQVALGPVLLSADQVGRLAGGGDILGMAYAQKDKEAALSSFDQQAGMQADLAAISGSSGNVGGEPGEAFAPGVEVMQKINDQGFWVVADNGQLNVDMDHTQVVNATDSIFWNQDPREILELQKSADGKAMVFVENGINFVVFSKGEIKQKQIIAAPAIFGENLELSTLIVKDVNQIPEGLRQGLDLQLGTTVLAVVNKNTGEVMQLIPSIFDFNDEVTLASIGEGQLILTVNNDGGEQKFQMQTVATDGWAESLLPQGVKEKFDQARIDPTDIENAEIKPDGLHITPESGEVIVLNNADLEKNIYLTQDNVLQYRDIDDKNVVYTFNKATRKLEVEPIKDYSICKIEKFYDCVVPYEDLVNGDYLRWLKTLSKPFDQTKIKDVPFVIHDRPQSIVPGETEIIYDTSTGPNFADPSSAPFRRDVTSGVVYYYHNGVQSFGILKPIEFYDKNDPDNNKWVITVDSRYYGDIENLDPRSERFTININIWKQWMRITPISTNFRAPTGLRDPLAMSTFERYPDMTARFERFVAGNVSALSGPGIILLAGENVKSTDNTYK